MNTLRSRTLIILMATLLAAVACGGGGSASDSIVTTPDGDADNGTGAESTRDGLPDFVIQDFTIPSTYSRIGDDLPILLRVANIGEAGGLIPQGWLMVSETDDFSTGYAFYSFGLGSVGGEASRLLEAGEERDFRAFVEPNLSQNGLLYARAWLNPDLSANFTNPEEYVVPSYIYEENNYDNNLSEVRSFEATEFSQSRCLPDALEENDTIATAAPIIPDTEYTINACNERLDVFSIDLQAGSVYELSLSDDPLYWPKAIVETSGRYLERSSTTNPLIFRPTTTGLHYLTMSRIEYGTYGQTVSFAINSLSK